MRLPKQSEVIDQSRKAIAPYNFIPLPEKIITISQSDLPDQGFYSPDRLTGHIDCELVTETPLFIRAGLNLEQIAAGKESKDLPEFYYLNKEKQPVIPGSSLRGMLRTLVEVVSYSKISNVDNKRMVYRAVGDTTNHGTHYRDTLIKFDGEQGRIKYYTPRIHGGYMVKMGARDWAIRPSKIIDGTSYSAISVRDDRLLHEFHPYKKCKNAYEVYIKTGKFEYQDVRGGFLKIKHARVERSSSTPQQGLRPAVLAKSGWMMGKLTDPVIYEADEKAPLIHITDDHIELYKEQISKEQKNILGDNGILVDGQPVFYVFDDQGNFVFLGHPRMFRIPYPNSPMDYIPAVLREPNDLDMTEAIFGYSKVRDGGSPDSFAGRVNFSDALLENGQSNLWLSPQSYVIPKILGSPKLTTFQHYLVQTQPNLYKIDTAKDGRQKTESRLSDYASPVSETVIRGHKFYWHKGQIGLDSIQEKVQLNTKDSVHTKINPLRSGVRFNFRIKFENLQPRELGALLWVLEIGSQESYRFKLGMGKPYGMGALKIISTVYFCNSAMRYRNLFNNKKWDESFVQDKHAEKNAKTSFENFVLQQISPNDESLSNVERIKNLLIMLSWPGPDSSLTRYMEIERADPTSKRGKRNEYKERPVLPSPFGVWAASLPNNAKSASFKFVKNKPSLLEGYERGTVLEFGLGPNKSFGFIRSDNAKPGDPDVFVHINQVSKGVILEGGARVIFQIREQVKNKKEAINVKVEN